MTLHDLHVRQLKQDPRRTCFGGGSFCILAKFRSSVAFSTMFRLFGSATGCAYSSSGVAYIISCVDSDNAWAGLKLMSNPATDLHPACLNFKGWVVLGPVPAVGVILTMCTLGYFHLTAGGEITAKQESILLQWVKEERLRVSLTTTIGLYV